MDNENNAPRTAHRLRINRSTPIATYCLIALCVAAYIADFASELITGTPMLTLYGAKINYYIFYGQYWRLITPMFLHANITHIAFNMFALYVWGRQIEALLGRARYLFVYFASGFLGCCASFAFSDALSVGASGAIFGLFGALLYFRGQHKEVFNAVFGVQVLVIIGVNLANGFISTNIDNFGHIGGLIGGFLACGITGFYGQRQLWWVRALYIAGFTLLCAGLIAGRYIYYLS